MACRYEPQVGRVILQPCRAAGKSTDAFAGFQCRKLFLLLWNVLVRLPCGFRGPFLRQDARGSRPVLSVNLLFDTGQRLGANRSGHLTEERGVRQKSNAPKDLARQLRLLRCKSLIPTRSYNPSGAVPHRDLQGPCQVWPCWLAPESGSGLASGSGSGSPRR